MVKLRSRSYARLSPRSRAQGGKMNPRRLDLGNASAATRSATPSGTSDLASAAPNPDSRASLASSSKRRPAKPRFRGVRLGTKLMQDARLQIDRLMLSLPGGSASDGRKVGELVVAGLATAGALP